MLPGQNSSPEEQQDAEAYFSEMLSYSLERLSKEPEYLAADQQYLARQGQEASIVHYRAYIGVAAALTRVQQALHPMRESLEALLQGVPVLNEESTSFGRSAESSAKLRSSNRQLLKQQGAVLEVLETPSLLATCTRSGAYEEALDLRAFAAKAALMHPGLKVVDLLASEAEAASASLSQALLARLTGPLQLPECLLLMGYLRRLGFLSEAALRQLFLECREQWLEGLLLGLDDSRGPYDYLKRLTDVHRLHLFDIIIHFQAVFSGGSASGAAPGEEESAVIYSWAEHRMVLYLEALQARLPQVREGSSLASVLEHCMYCGMSLGRVGLDFRALLPPLFEGAALGLFAATTQTTVDTFHKQLEGHRWVELASHASRARASASAAASEPAVVAALEAPQELLDHPPLAVFANGIVSAFNELRHCAPLSLAPAVAALVQSALEASAQGLAVYWAAQSQEKSEARVFLSACRAFCSLLCPFAGSCIQHVYGGPAVSSFDPLAACAPLQAILTSSGGP